jgi:AraC-like DNA-binding protein
MQPHAFAPPEELRDAIKGFWHSTLDFGELPSTFEILPDGYAEIIFYFGSARSISTLESRQPLSSPCLVGLLNRPVLLHAQHRLEVIGVKCFPWTVFELLGLPAGQDGVRVFEHPIAQLQAPLTELMQAGEVAEAIALLQQYFLASRSQQAGDNTLVKAGGAMREAKGTLPVSQVAAAAHATVRTLERKFKQAAGYTVKDVSALLRFEQVRNHLWLQPAANLAGLAQELGYTDQAHLSREFKRYSGTTPAAFARNAKRKQRVVPVDFVAFVQA